MHNMPSEASTLRTLLRREEKEHENTKAKLQEIVKRAESLLNEDTGHKELMNFARSLVKEYK